MKNRVLKGIHHSPSWLNTVDSFAPAVTFAISALVVFFDQSLPYWARSLFSLSLNYLFRTPKAYIELIQWLLARALFFVFSAFVYFVILLPYQAVPKSRRSKWLAEPEDPKSVSRISLEHL